MNGGVEPVHENENPYASPLTETANIAKLPEGIWVFGNLVIAHRNAEWPRICVLTGAPADQQLEFSLSTQYPAWIILVFLGSLISTVGVCLFTLPRVYSGLAAFIAAALHFAGLFVAMGFLAMPRQLQFYISENVAAERKRKLRMALGLNLTGVLFVILGFFGGGSFILVGIVLGFLIGAIGGSHRARWGRILSLTKMHREYTVFRGAGAPFLATLPTWPYETA